jgi:hypothetical protein
MREVYGGTYTRKRARLEAERWWSGFRADAMGWTMVATMVAVTYYKFFIE